MLFKTLSTPNGRLLYMKSTGFAGDWTTKRARLVEFIGQHPKLSFASLKTYLYFFTSPTENHFPAETAWVALEIVGQPQLDPEGEILSYDLDQGKVFRSQLLFQGKTNPLYPEGLKLAYTEAMNALKAETVAATWRVVVEEEVHEGNLTVKLFMDFFPEGE